MAHVSSSGDSDDHSELQGSTKTPSVIARLMSRATTWVHLRRTQALEFCHHVTHMLFNLLQLLVSVLVNSFIVRTTWGHMRLHLGQLLITRMAYLADLFTVRAQTHSTTSCDPSRISWNLKAFLKERMMIIISRMNIEVMFNVSKSYIQALMWNTFCNSKIQQPIIQQTTTLSSLNQELRGTIFAKLPMIDIIRLQAVCKDFANIMTNDTFKAVRNMNEGSFGPHVFYLENNMTYMTWQWISYDLNSQQWKRMPSFSSVPLPDIELFKDFFVAVGGGLFCIGVGKGSNEKMIVYQPLTKQQKILPPLIHWRRPVLIHVFVEEKSNTYRIIAAGCSTNGSKNLSRKTEVYDSCTRRWYESDDIPGPEFALNEYQTGVYVRNLKILFCIGFLPEDKGRGILAYNVETGVWIKNALCQLPQNFLYDNIRVPTQITIAQLLEYNGDIFLFSEQESGQEVTHSIHKLQGLEQFGIIDDDGYNTNKAKITWERILCESRKGIRGLLIYPEFECLAHGKDKFCIFNTIERTGALYDIYYKNGVYTFDKQKLPLFPRLKEDSLTFHTLNPLGFAFDPTFKISL